MFHTYERWCAFKSWLIDKETMQIDDLFSQDSVVVEMSISVSKA